MKFNFHVIFCCCMGWLVSKVYVLKTIKPKFDPL
jgi:hypothetical protein